MSDDGTQRKVGSRTKATRANGRDGVQEADDTGILAALPRTRPQRSSPRRASARRSGERTAAETGAASEPRTAANESRKTTSERHTVANEPRKAANKPRKTTSEQRKTTGAAVRGGAKRKATARRREPSAPRQGYEPLEERRGGGTVQPPSGAELVESIATIFGELASAGLKAGGRLLKDALSPLRRP